MSLKPLNQSHGVSYCVIPTIVWLTFAVFNRRHERKVVKKMPWVVTSTMPNISLGIRAARFRNTFGI